MYDKADANVKSDEVTVTVNQGAVTVVAAGDQSYYLGEQVKLSGTNTESFTTYLFMVGPNLPLTGGELSNPQVSVAPAVPGSTASNGFTEQATVNGDNTWSYTWGTAGIQLDAGTYTIYAESQPILATDTTGLGNEAFGTVSIIIKKPFVSATASSAVVAEGDNMFVTGTAEGNPTPGVAIWILGKNYAVYTTQTVNADASFSYRDQEDRYPRPRSRPVLRRCPAPDAEQPLRCPACYQHRIYGRAHRRIGFNQCLGCQPAVDGYVR